MLSHRNPSNFHHRIDLEFDQAFFFVLSEEAAGWNWSSVIFVMEEATEMEEEATRTQGTEMEEEETTTHHDSDPNKYIFVYLKYILFGIRSSDLSRRRTVRIFLIHKSCKIFYALAQV